MDSRALLRQAKSGNARALDQLFRTELPRLRRWAYSRVPRPLWPRADPDDLVQLTFLRALRRYCSFESRAQPEFQHYLRRILLNLTRDEIRRRVRQPESVELVDLPARFQPSPIDILLGREAARRFRAAVRALPLRSRTALLARLERGLDYDEIARLIGAPGPNAARAVISRATERVARHTRDSHDRRVRKSSPHSLRPRGAASKNPRRRTR